jgi:phosphoglycolate phosphatase
MSLPPLQAILFDLDGTLVDSLPGITWAVRIALAEVRPGSELPDLRPFLGPPIQEIFRLALPDAAPAMRAALERKFRTAYDDEGWRKTVAFPGVPETLAELKRLGMQCFGVTNKPALPTQRILAHCGLDRFFEVFLSTDSRQPALTSKSAATQTLLEKWHLHPRATCLVGDTLEDAHVARACGMAFVAYSGGYGWSGLCAELPEVEMFEDFPALPALLLGRGMTVEWPTQPAPTTMKI